MLKKLSAVLLSVSLMVAGAAHAVLPAAVGTTVTQIETDANDIFALVFPVVGAILALTIIIKLFKRFSNKV